MIGNNGDNGDDGANPPPSHSPSIPNLPSHPNPTILLSSLTNHSISVDFTHDSVGLLAVF